MPRTKKPKTKSKKSTSRKAEQHAVPAAILAEVNDVKLQWDSRREQLILKRNDVVTAITRTFNMAIMKLGPMENLEMCWDSEDENEENVKNAPSNASPLDTTVSTSVPSPDFVSVSSSFMTQSDLSVTNSRRSRSRNVAQTPAQRSISVTNSTTGCVTATRTLRSSSHGRDRLAEMTARNDMPPPSMRNRFCTPATHMVPDGSRYNVITPKVVPNSSVSVLRRPRGGEMAFAMTGSPLMVTSNSGDDVCNVNLPLGDGRVLSILPTGLRPRDLPHMNDETMVQLVQLRHNLDLILRDCEPVKKY